MPAIQNCGDIPELSNQSLVNSCPLRTQGRIAEKFPRRIPIIGSSFSYAIQEEAEF